MGDMGMTARHLDRLLPRHELADRRPLSWNVRLERKSFLKKEEVSTPAVIRDLSLEGALVEVPATDEIEPGTRVHVRFLDLNGVVEVRHRRVSEEGYVLYGVRFIPEPALRDAINSEVGTLRGRSAELNAAWLRQN
ncbi:MAG: hypothetical protein ACI9C1_002487 [Candidatus Aldehydirespiratoraceae bacterium]|jgi:hypothetical protein